MKTPTQDEIDFNIETLVLASKRGDIEEVKKFIFLADPKANGSEALQWAAQYGYTEIVKLLIPVSDPTALNSEALRCAVTFGHRDIVELLIPVSDPGIQNSQFLRVAVENGHKKIIELLIPVSDYTLVLQKLSKQNDIKLLQHCIEKCEALQQKERLQQDIEHIQNNTKKSITRKI